MLLTSGLQRGRSHSFKFRQLWRKRSRRLGVSVEFCGLEIRQLRQRSAVWRLLPCCRRVFITQDVRFLATIVTGRAQSRRNMSFAEVVRLLTHGVTVCMHQGPPCFFTPCDGFVDLNLPGRICTLHQALDGNMRKTLQRKNRQGQNFWESLTKGIPPYGPRW